MCRAMSYAEYKPLLEEGDNVVLYMGPRALKPITVTKGEVINNKYGHFRHDDMVSLPAYRGLALPGSHV